MIRQSKKSNIEVMKKYLDLAGANPNSYKLVKKRDSYMFRYLYRNYKVGTRQEQIKTINKINNYDGIAIIYVDFKGNERVENYIFLTILNICWDNSKESKRLKRIKKIISKIKKI